MNDDNPIIVRVKDFTTIPGPRFRSSGDNSAEQFFEEHVLPKLEENKQLVIDFSETWGYGPSFTSQLGICLVDKIGKDAPYLVRGIATDDPEVVERFMAQMKEYIHEKF